MRIICLLFILVYTLGHAQITYVDAFPNIDFDFPVEISCPDDGTNRMFVVEQKGVIKVFDIDESVTNASVFLDIQNLVLFSSGQEIGLLGLAFHPNFIQNGYFYVYYTKSSPVAGVSIRMTLSRFSVNSSNPNLADANSELIILEFDKNQDNSNHNGGKIAFGPDSYLYMSVGDGGGANDPNNNAQNKENFFGSICRIDIDLDNSNPISSNGNYEIPSDNPYVGVAGLDEIFAVGIRNTWKFSFDFPSNRLWGADVGQGAFEEINLIENGMNLGWSRFEANNVVNSSITISDNVTFPIYFYNHNQGDVSITGGYVYRGSGITSLTPNIQNKYVYGDFVSGRVWALDYNETTQQVTNELIFKTNGQTISSFGKDNHDEIYFSSYSTTGKIFKLVDGITPPSGNIVNGVGSWESLNNNIDGGIITSLDTDTNNNLYVVGSFNQIASLNVSNIAVWNSSTGWSSLGSGTDGIINTVKVAPNGNVYIGGSFTQISGVSAKNLAVWNGSAWAEVGSGIEGTVAVIEIDSNNGLYIGGIFKEVSGLTANNIAYYNGNWSVLSGSLNGTNNEVRSLAIGPDNTLYVGGNFDTAGGISANRIATWNGSSWGTLGIGTSGFVEAIVATDTDVFVGGNFATAGGKTVNRIARWSKSSSEWFSLENGVSNNVTSLIHNDVHLYAAGSFDVAFNNSENIIVNNIARWSTNGWEAMGTNTNVGVDIKINNITFPNDSNEKVFAGGNFATAGLINTNNIALWSSENVLNVNEFSEEIVNIFPNPADNFLNLSKKQEWKIFNYLGSLIKKGNNISIEIDNLASGIYVLKLKNGRTFKFIKK